jgi:hypothetical protein
MRLSLHFRARQKIWRIIRYLFGFAENVHTAIWLVEILGFMAILTGIYAWVLRYFQQDMKRFMIVAFFIEGFILLTVPRLIYTSYLRRKSATLPARPPDPIAQLHKTFEPRLTTPGASLHISNEKSASC